MTKNRTISLIDIWNFAFIFIILSEVFSDKTSETTTHLGALKYLIIANNLIFMGYITKLKLSSKDRVYAKEKVFNTRKITHFTIISCVVFYFAFSIEKALYTFAVGRNITYNINADSNEFNLFGPLLSAMSFVLPAIITYYFTILRKKSLFISILYSSPIFLILFLNGTRFVLLFSFSFGFCIILFSKGSNKLSIRKGLIFISAITILLVSQQN